jgi:hypothetical protein
MGNQRAPNQRADIGLATTCSRRLCQAYDQVSARVPGRWVPFGDLAPQGGQRVALLPLDRTSSTGHLLGMSEEGDMRIAAAAARARTAMAAGATLDDVLRTFRTLDQLGVIESMRALMEISKMDLSCAKLIVANSCEGRSYAQLTLADLELLGDAPHVGGVDHFTRRSRADANIERKPYLLCVRDRRTTRSVAVYSSAIPLEAQPAHPAIEMAGTITGDSVTFERVCEDVRRAAAAWPTELRILRDEPDQLLLHFVRAPLVS